MIPGLEEMGIRMLLNECENISRGDQLIYLSHGRCRRRAFSLPPAFFGTQAAFTAIYGAVLEHGPPSALKCSICYSHAQ
jgi:hypothetical protein